ncbi:hypothetical protein ASPVEDRAFT_64648 [Aspergillus versicolor CBS 583.65]|uniref:Protein phosphatase 4 core regulatory subunit R2 n=1 Tax=Aspergillus versicolor CBS 583.65 TaxID=1036611 RepID=A0A1L9PW59_ASPVE|nr:uncharacterized protein ASPVEDRAFT_64648 [Aspergillus versicolor CBS 583.65]OJJ05656.1 hypothetical protein ASPVEDRAFT_64648 [Aspergillus versicolor CBS 583.65]
MSLDEESLERAASGGTMDLDKWPGIVEPLLERLEFIIYNVFPMPQMPPDPPSADQYQQQYLNPTSSFLHDPNPVPSSSNKENTEPPNLQTPPRPPPSLNPPSSTERVPDSGPASQADTATATLPAPLLLTVQSIQTTLRSLFTSKPPHTIQRLAELILRPNAYYRTLPAYLRAVDRVVSVTSSADVFPFPMQSGAATAQPQPNGTLNGAENKFILPDNTLGSDESLGGALLTPIPWLSNPASPGPEGAGIDEVPMATTTPTLQNQLLTQPTDSTSQPVVATEGDGTILEGELTAEPTDGVPHARGPSVLGVEDLGLQDGRDVEVTLLNRETEGAGASSTGDSTIPIATSEQPGHESAPSDSDSTAVTATAQKDKDTDADADADGDGDITLSDEPTIPQEGQGEKK